MSAHNAHNFSGHFIQWAYCIKCGLLALKNEASRKAARKPCKGE